MQKKAEIIIIGAGMAGLTAARLLQDSGFEVLVLEAKNRVGGRTHTIKLNDAWLDAGASWIHYYKGNPLTYIAKANGFPIIEDYYDPFHIWDEENKQAISRKKRKYMAATERAIDAASDYFVAQDRGTESATDFLATYLSTRNWTDKKKRIVRQLYTALLEASYGGKIDTISLSDDKYIDTFEEEEENDALIIGGYRNIIDLLKEGLDIRLDTRVQAIDYSDDIVQIQTSQGKFTSKKVILSVPLGVLKQNTIQFTPALPHSKQKAIQSIGYGDLEKVILRFGQKFWGDIKQGIYLEECEQGFVFPSIIDYSESAGAPTLVVFYAAQFAAHTQAKSDTEILAATLSVLQKLFGKNDIQPTHYHITRWLTDDCFFGTYSFSQDANTATNIAALAEPLADKLFFAGEATSVEGQGYVHGALLSGVREARRFGASINSILGLEEFFAARAIS